MKNNIAIVDKKDNVIGSKQRLKVEKSDIYRVTALWITNSNKEILLAQRGFIKDNSPGAWGPSVAGTVEAGETYDQNIYKEAEEELGIKNINFSKSINYFMDLPTRTYFAQIYTTKLDWDIDQFSLQKDEVENLK